MDYQIASDDTFAPQDTLVSQIQALSEYIARGIEHGCGDCIGLELEHFIVRAADSAFVPYLDDPKTGAVGVGTILERLAPLYEERIYETLSDGSQHLIGLARPYATITLEPGAQFEISIGPVLEIRDLSIVYDSFRTELDSLLTPLGYRLLELGYHPTASARDIPLIPKDRYRFMDEHFRSTGQHGICMMRATASTQVSIDYTSEADAIRKFRVANSIGPLLAFITDNSPLFEKVPVGSNETPASGLPVPRRMARTAIWNDVDAHRSLVAPHTFDEDFGFDSYAATILRAPAIFTLEAGRNGEKRSVPQGLRSFAVALASREFDRATIEHILSLFFFDVRFKTYIEIRMADSLPIDYALAFAALIKGLFYNAENLGRLEQQLAHVDEHDIAFAKAALRDRGYDALVYQRPADEWLDQLVEMARGALGDDERSYLEPLAELVAARTTLVERAMPSMAKRKMNAAQQGEMVPAVVLDVMLATTNATDAATAADGVDAVDVGAAAEAVTAANGVAAVAAADVVAGAAAVDATEAADVVLALADAASGVLEVATEVVTTAVSTIVEAAVDSL